MYTITKQFHFSASHQLDKLPSDHKCARLHGHNYIVEVELQSNELDQVGFVIDYGELSAFKQYIEWEIDHRHLNDLFSFHTSAENLAKHFYDWCKGRWQQTTSVKVSETPKTWAEYRE